MVGKPASFTLCSIPNGVKNSCFAYADLANWVGRSRWLRTQQRMELEDTQVNTWGSTPVCKTLKVYGMLRCQRFLTYLKIHMLYWQCKWCNRFLPSFCWVLSHSTVTLSCIGDTFNYFSVHFCKIVSWECFSENSAKKFSPLVWRCEFSFVGLL